MTLLIKLGNNNEKDFFPLKMSKEVHNSFAVTLPYPTDRLP